MARNKRYEDGGLTFADISEEERKAGIEAALADIEARSAAKAAEASESEVETPVKRAAPKKAEKKTQPAPKAEAPKTPREERAPSTVKAGAITGPAPAKSREAAMPDVAARRAETQARTGRRSVFGENKGVYGMKAGGSVSSASKRADGCAIRGKTKGRVV